VGCGWGRTRGGWGELLARHAAHLHGCPHLLRGEETLSIYRIPSLHYPLNVLNDVNVTCAGGYVRVERRRQTPWCHEIYRGTSLIRNAPLLGPYSRTIPKVPWWSLGGGLFLMSEAPL